ncbi:MAG: PD40 domain-containing protein [Acidobacteria bacterium]|nr:PD40 domain-containing protein [Acidobacteriota bacterium]
MHTFFPIGDCNAFHCFRILPPLLASLLPLGALDAFLVTGFVFQVAAGTMLWLIAEHLHGSRKVAVLTCCWFWLTWGSMHSFSDPLLITDPVQAFWSFAALYLLLTERYAAALPLLVLGATVKESVLLVPAICAVYAWFTAARTPARLCWLALLVVAPAAAWLALRFALHRWFGYATADDGPYLLRLYFFTGWVPSLGPAPWNAVTAAAYSYGAFGGAWILGALGLRQANRRQRVLSFASIPPMVFLSLYQSPDRALASFPYAILIPAALFIRRLPAPITAALLLSNAAFIVVIRRGAAFWWLPRVPVLIVATAVLIGCCVYAARLAPAASAYGEASAVRPRRGAGGVWRERLIIGATTGVVVALSGWLLWRAVVSSSFVPLTAVSGAPLESDDGGGTPGLAVSPDGSRIAFVGGLGAGRELWVRSVTGASEERLAATANASEPFWSPDGRSIGFFAEGALKTIALDTRAIATLTAAPDAHGGAWSRKGTIVFAPTRGGGLLKVAASGGAPAPATTVDVAHERGHGWPSFLPDGDHFLFLVTGASPDRTGLHLGSLSSGRSAPIDDRAQPPARAVLNAVYAEPGLLFFARPDGVWIQPFDGRRMAALSRREQLTDGVRWTPAGRGAFAIGGRTLVFAAGSEEPNGPPSTIVSARWDGVFADRRP